jgi:hypothetical protein
MSHNVVQIDIICHPGTWLLILEPVWVVWIVTKWSYGKCSNPRNGNGLYGPYSFHFVHSSIQECCRNLFGTVGSYLNPTIWKTGIYCILYNPNIKNSHIKLSVICSHLKNLTFYDSSNTFYISPCSFLGIFFY